MNTESSSRRRLLVLVILPLVLVFGATPLAAHLTPQGRFAARGAQPSVAAEPIADTEQAKTHRKAALEIVERLKQEADHAHGTTRLTPADLQRLRNALR